MKYLRSDFVILDFPTPVRSHTLLAYTPSLSSKSVQI